MLAGSEHGLHLYGGGFSLLGMQEKCDYGNKSQTINQEEISWKVIKKIRPNEASLFMLFWPPHMVRTRDASRHFYFLTTLTFLFVWQY